VYAGHAGRDGLHDDIKHTAATKAIKNKDFFIFSIFI
jgi:hypothetical protein